MSKAFELVDNVPAPKAQTRTQSYPFERMKVGDSFWCPRKKSTVTSAVYQWKRNDPARAKMRFIVRDEDRHEGPSTTPGCRCWRVEDVG